MYKTRLASNEIF